MQRRNTVAKLFGVIILIIFYSASASATTKKDHIIDNAIKAYGGPKLTQLQSLTFADRMDHYSQWQSSNPLQGDRVGYLNERQTEFIIDFANQRTVLRQATSRVVGSHATDVPSVMHRLYVDGKGYAIDHASREYLPSPRITFDNAALGTNELITPLIIRQLNKDRSQAHWQGMAYIQGVAHDILTVKSGARDEYSVYLNKDTGYLSRLIRKQGEQLLSYDFLEYQQTNGIAWAKRLFVSTGKAPVYHSRVRQLTFNAAHEREFNIPTNYALRPENAYVDVSELTIKQLADNVYFVGKGWGYTLFVDVGDHYISSGAWQMDSESETWQQGLDLLRQTTGDNKPIKLHVVTHHHTDHMMGLDDVVNQGAVLAIHPNDIPIVQAQLAEPLLEDRFLAVTENRSLANGNLRLINVPNSHANHNWVIYLPEQKLLFSEDIFGSSLQSGFHSPAYWPDGDTYSRLDGLTDTVERLALDIEQYVSSHHARVLSREELYQAAKIQVPSKEVLLKRLFSSDDDV